MKATPKQIIAIKNLRSYIECGIKTEHDILSDEEIQEIENLTLPEASKRIEELIKQVRRLDETADRWGPTSLMDYLMNFKD